MVTAPTTAPDLLARLKAETRADHDAIEAALDLAGGGLTRDRYRRTLERFYGFYRPLEAGLLVAGAWAGCGLDPADRQKAPLLAADLRALGADPDALPDCPRLPSHATAASAFGVLYVLEGATLGGQVVSRHLRPTLGITTEAGGRFFRGYGERTGEMWQAFRSSLVAFAAGSENDDEIAAAAIATFRTLRLWCEGGLPR